MPATIRKVWTTSGCSRWSSRTSRMKAAGSRAARLPGHQMERHAGRRDLVGDRAAPGQRNHASLDADGRERRAGARGSAPRRRRRSGSGRERAPSPPSLGWYGDAGFGIDGAALSTVEADAPDRLDQETRDPLGGVAVEAGVAGEHVLPLPPKQDGGLRHPRAVDSEPPRTARASGRGPFRRCSRTGRSAEPRRSSR